MCFPDFIGIGGQRCGSTLLFELLKQHPEICVPCHKKEIHYFDKYYGKGRNWYLSHFRHCKGKCTGEFTPVYLFHEKCPKRIYKLNPEVKLIAILRNPIDRAYSQFKFNIKEKGGSLSFQEFLEKHSDALRRGLYFEQLSRYLNFFKLSNFKIVLFENMINNPAEEVGQIYDFLGIDSLFIPKELNKKVNPSQIPRFHKFYVFTKKLSSKLYESDLNWIVSILKKIGVKDLFFSAPKHNDSFPPLSPGLHKWLKEFYERDIAQLSALLSMNLNEIWNFPDEKCITKKQK